LSTAQNIAALGRRRTRLATGDGSCIEKRGRGPEAAAGTAYCRFLVCGVAAFMLATRPAGAASDDTPAAECGEPFDVRIWWSPREPMADLRLRLIAVADREPVSGLVAIDPAGRTMPLEVVGQSGPPWSLVATIERPPSGSWRIEARRGEHLVACRKLEVATPVSRPRGALEKPPKEAATAWDRASEALYAVWISHLFDAPADANLAFPSLEPVLRDPTRNLLHDYLGLGEDDAGPKALRATPDCADLPYFLRAYFAWKLGLPFGFRACSRGSSSLPPRCGPPATNEQGMQRRDSLEGFKEFSQRVVDVVQSGNARTALEDDATDFYPVPLERDTLRPGTIYADPYGHTLMIVRWVPQTPEHSGLLLAVDAQPDASVGRKRFWEGTFLFASGLPSAGPGFKAFRPLVRGSKEGRAAASDQSGGRLRPLSNRELLRDPRFVLYSKDQETLSSDDFYARMAKLINPSGVDPSRAYEDTLDALVEQLETRVGSVDNGERYLEKNRRVVIPMPVGSGIFETTGLWEDYSTPSRDMRLLIAMKVLADLPERVVRHPDLFVLGSRRANDVRAELEQLHARRVGERAITYTRNDGSPWRLTVAELLSRKTAFEMAYNPNDCVELRWGAGEGTPEYQTCRSHAPSEQRRRMEEYRIWFRETRRPPR